MTRSNTARRAPLPRPEPGLDTALRRARIESRDVASGTVGVTFAPGTPRVSATLTLAAGAAAVGDTALCASADDGGWYVLGVVPSYPREVRPGGERTVVRLPPGPVDVVADGDVTWSTTGAMRIEARAGVTLSASSADPDAPFAARLTVDPERIHADAPHLDARTDHADLTTGHASVTAEVVETTARVLRRAVGVLETDAERILERAEATYREVRDVAQTRAGRLRTLVEHTASVLADRFVLKTRSDVRIDGERIHLG